jgi:hypothetical protein
VLGGRRSVVGGSRCARTGLAHIVLVVRNKFIPRDLSVISRVGEGLATSQSFADTTMTSCSDRIRGIVRACAAAAATPARGGVEGLLRPVELSSGLVCSLRRRLKGEHCDHTDAQSSASGSPTIRAVAIAKGVHWSSPSRASVCCRSCHHHRFHRPCRRYAGRCIDRKTWSWIQRCSSSSMNGQDRRSRQGRSSP